jgi:hypothetical protein
MGLKAALTGDSKTLVAMARRNPLTLAMIVGGMMAVGVWLYGVEGQVRSIEHTQTRIERKLVAQSVCADHPGSKLCLRGISHALEACLADIHCSTLLASAPEASQHLQEAAQATRKARAAPPRGIAHHSEQPVSVSPGGSGEGGGHSGPPVPAHGVPPVPEHPAPVTPAPSPQPPATPAPPTPAPAPPAIPPVSAPPPHPVPPAPGPSVCLNNPLLPACIHIGLGSGADE